MFLLLILFALLVNAQTLTTIDAAGESVVVVVTLGIDGVPTTSTIQTLPDATTATTTTTTTSSSTTSTTTATPPPQQQGPVGQPGPTAAPGGVTPFTYTTIINGVTQVTTDVFTPTAPATRPTTAPATGTILDYSQWLSQVGGAAQTASSSSASELPLHSTCWIIVVLVSCIGLMFMIHT